MALHPDYPRTRLFVEAPLHAEAEITLPEKQAHYLSHVLRLKPGDTVALFNGREGEWRAGIESVEKKSVRLAVQRALRTQRHSADIWLLCAPLRNAKSEWVVEKATELGVCRICPVITKHTVVDRINESRLAAIAIESAEQCERMDVPQITPLTALTRLLADWPQERILLFGDESGASLDAKTLLAGLKAAPLAVLIGPEGGFSTQELDLLQSLPYIKGMCMGPRVLRADTAALSALTLLQAWCGDWDGKPAFRQP